MKQENITKLNYEEILKSSLKGVLKEVLNITQAQGIPGSHHFFITLDTTHSGVIIGKSLRLAYPEELTIVIQHQFWDLRVEEKFFEITLSFDGKKQHLHIPFEAVTAFTDPHANFGLQFRTKLEKETIGEMKIKDSEQKQLDNNNEISTAINQEIESNTKNNESPDISESIVERKKTAITTEKKSDKVVNLDNFRKNK